MSRRRDHAGGAGFGGNADKLHAANSGEWPKYLRCRRELVNRGQHSLQTLVVGDVVGVAEVLERCEIDLLQPDLVHELSDRSVVLTYEKAIAEMHVSTIVINNK